MKFTREQLLNVVTLVDKSINTIITADEIYDDDVGMVIRGFNMKAHMPENEFKEAMSGDPGDYILAHYPADGTIAKDCLERLSIDEALCFVNGSSSNFSVFFWRVGTIKEPDTFAA